MADAARKDKSMLDESKTYTITLTRAAIERGAPQKVKIAMTRVCLR